MTDRTKLRDRARDELFSHINRCGVLQAAEDDQTQWMDETMEYLAERYPDLNELDLKQLYDLGMRFCRPAIPHGRPNGESADAEQDVVDASEADASEARPTGANESGEEETVGAAAGETAVS